MSAIALSCVSLTFALLTWLFPVTTAVAQPGLTIGFAVDGNGLVSSSERGEELGHFLESQINLPVKTRIFTSENLLSGWMIRFLEVDVAWLSDGVVANLPAGQLFPLASKDISKASPRGMIVVRQGLNPALRKQIANIFLNMHETAAGQALLSTLGASRFVPPPLQNDPVKMHKVAPLAPESLSRQRDNTNSQISVGHIPRAPDQTPREVAVDTTLELAEIQVSGGGGAHAGEESQIVPQDDQIIAKQNEEAERPLPVAVDEQSETSAQISAPKIDQSGQVALAADYLAYDSVQDSYEAKGDVVLRQADVELKSETLLWQSVTQDAAAQGSVLLRDSGTEVTGESMQYNVATGQGQIKDGRLFVREGNFHLVGEQIEKHSQADYYVKQGSFTTCDGEIPDWKFSASEVDVTLGGYARAKNVWFHIKDVPILYTPYLSFPVMTERESGFLTPTFGYSNNKGTRASLAWYQVIDRHMDATVSLDYYSDIGLGKGLEYRYALANQNNGQAFYQHVTGFNDTPNLYYLKWSHRGKLPVGWQLTVDAEYANKKLYFEEFGEVAEDYNRDKTVSKLMLRRNWQKLNLVGIARYIKDLEDDELDPLQTLPEVGLSLARYRLGDSSFFAGLESYATRFWRDEGEDGERLFIRPSLAAVFKPGSWLEVAPEIAFYERLYNAEGEDDEAFLPEYSLALSTRLVKTYAVNRWGVERLQHSVEPKAVYTYIPDESQDGLPFFDLHDRIERRNEVGYALVNRLISRSQAADGLNVYRELLNLRLSQSYDIDEERHNRSGENQPFSDLRVELGLHPATNFSLTLDGRVPVYGNMRFRTLNVGASIRDDMGNAMRIDYSYKDIDASGLATDYLRVQIDTPLLKPLYIRLEERYDFRDNRALEKVVGLEYRAKCWSIFLTYRNRYREFEKDDQEVMLSFVLAGLGMGEGFGAGF